MTSLSDHHCVPCEGGTKPMTKEEYAVYLPQVTNWEIVNEKQLKREFTFQNFKEVLAFVNRIGEVAESEGHHPDLFLHDWKELTVTLTTFAIGGLSINDFVMAVKIDELQHS